MTALELTLSKIPEKRKTAARFARGIPTPAAPLSCSVKRSKAKHFSIPFRKKGGAPKLKKEKNVLLRAAVRRAEPRGGLVPFKIGSSFVQQLRPKVPMTQSSVLFGLIEDRARTFFKKTPVERSLIPGYGLTISLQAAASAL